MLMCVGLHHAVVAKSSIGSFADSSLAVRAHNGSNVQNTPGEQAVFPGIVGIAAAVGVGLALAGLAASFVVGVVAGVADGVAAAGQAELAWVESQKYDGMDFSKFD
ncbi:hypothetical protein BH10PSE19_BH10PSE19_19400 [soil metagenome]